MKPIVIQSHRGAGHLAPENSIDAFLLGWKLGTVPEADLRTTRDGVIVAFHDPAFSCVDPDRPGKLLTKNIGEVSWDELLRIDVGAWKGDRFEGRRVSRIAEVFSLMPGHPEREIYLDIKAIDLPALAGEVRKEGVGPQVILASTDYQVIREWMELVPGGRTLHWMGGDDATLSGRLEELKRNDFVGVSQLQIHIEPGWEASGTRRNPATIRRNTIDPFLNTDAFLHSVAGDLERRGILFQVLPWKGTGDCEEVYWKLLDLGAKSFATDHPDLALRALAAYRPVANGSGS